MQLTQFSDFSLRVLLYLGMHPGQRCTIDQISKRFAIPRNHLVKVVHQLSQKGHIESFRGQNGGIRLAHDPKSYRIGDLICSTEPHMNLVDCFDQKYTTCPIARVCELEVVLHKARQVFLDTLNEYSLADFLNAKSARQTMKILELG